MKPGQTITYLRQGRQVRACGEVIGSTTPGGMTKVKPTRKEWGAVWLTAAEIEAGKEKPPVVPRTKQAEAPDDLKPKQKRKPKTPPPPRWKQLVDRVRLYEVDHHPEGWPGVQMKFLTELADELEAAQTLFKSES